MQRDREARASGDAGVRDEVANAPRVARARPFRPVALRPVTPEPAQALAERERRNWLDALLLIGERGLGAAVVLLLLHALIDGPGRDWMRARSADAASSAPTGQSAVKPKAQPAPKAPQVAQAQKVRRRELGASLPSIPRVEQQPRAQADYLTPARRYVAGAPPEAPAAAVAAPAAAPAAVAPAPDLRPTHLRVPRVGIDTPVVEVFLHDDAWQVADYAAGYHHGTGLPGSGNVVMAGHKGLRGSVFAELEQVQAGDEIVVEAAGQRFHYRVRAMGRVWPADVGVMYPTPTPTLTLLTCTNWDTQRFVVIADLVDSAGLQPSLGG